MAFRLLLSRFARSSAAATLLLATTVSPALADRQLKTYYETVAGQAFSVNCAAALVDSDAGSSNYYLKVAVSLQNQSSATITSAEIEFELRDSFGTVLGRITGEKDGTYSPGILIEPKKTVWGTFQPDFSAINIWPTIASVDCKPRRARFEDGSVWVAQAASPTPSPEPSDSTQYSYAFHSVSVAKSPITIVEGSGSVTNSAVGTQSFYATTCYLAHNTTGKVIKLERYQMTFKSAFNDTLGDRFDTIRHDIQPYSDDLFDSDKHYSECLRAVNPWGTDIGAVYFKPVEILFEDGSVWRAPKP